MFRAPAVRRKFIATAIPVLHSHHYRRSFEVGGFGSPFAALKQYTYMTASHLPVYKFSGLTAHNCRS